MAADAWTLEPTWTLEPAGVRLAFGPLSAACDPNRPELGLSELRYAGSEIAAQLLTVNPRGRESLGPAEDYYIRGVDLVARYAACEAFPFGAELEWSAALCAEGRGVALRLTVSLQTDLLDSSPEVEVATQAVGATAEASDDKAARFGVSGVLLAQAPHPSDAAETEASIENGKHLLTLRPPFLEKGVIRRCRVAVFVLPEDATPDQLAAALASFIDEPLPLTA